MAFRDFSSLRNHCQPALLRSPAMIFKFFTPFRTIALMTMLMGLNCGFEFEKGRHNQN